MRPCAVDWQEWCELAAVPPFNEDDEPDPGRGVRALRTALTAADALLIATPEYNGSIPGQLKNVVDWASRPPDAGALAGKPVAVVGASPSRYGASQAQAELRKVLGNAGAQVLDRELPVTRGHEAFTPDGRLADPALVQRLRKLVDDLAAIAEPCDRPGLAGVPAGCG